MKRSTASEMPLYEKLYLGALEKYRLRNKFPWQLVSSIILVLLTSIQVSLFVSDSSAYARDQNKLWNIYFGTSDENYLYQMSNLKEEIDNSISNYYSLTNKTLQTYEYVYKDSEIAPIEMHVLYLSAETTLDEKYKIFYNISDK